MAARILPALGRKAAKIMDVEISLCTVDVVKTFKHWETLLVSHMQ